LALDCETSGINYDQSKPVNEKYQSVSWGFVVSDMKTMKPIDTLYVEVKWNGVSVWSNKAEKVHGLSREHLEAHGLSEEDAAAKIAQFIATHFDIEETIITMGHNVGTFDLHFLRDLLYKFGWEFLFSHRCIDTFSLGVVLLDTYDSQTMFDFLQIKRGKVHNALDDALGELESARKMQEMFLRAFE
jgi:hypothetical protein